MYVKVISKMKRTGFTIVELLIVIVVIGILAAITIVAYSGIQNRGNDSAVQADLNNFAKLMEVQKADVGTYPATLTAAMGFKFSKNSYGRDVQSRNVSYCINTSTDQYVLFALSKSGNSFQYLSGYGLTTAALVYGWDICRKVGLTNVQPEAGVITNTWAAWAN